MLESYDQNFNKNNAVSNESLQLQKKMMSAKVFKMHKRVNDPLELNISYSLNDFNTMELQILENSQFLILTEDLDVVNYFEIKR